VKITIECDNEGETWETLLFEHVFELALTGRYVKGGLSEARFSHLHVSDKYALEGSLYELIARLKDARTD